METTVVAGALGGAKVLGASVRTSGDLGRLVRKGIPAAAVPVLAGKLELANGALADKLGIPNRTLSRRLSQGASLTPTESDRTVRMARVYATAVEFLGDARNAVE